MWYEAITHVFQWTTWIVPWCTYSWSKESKTWLYTHYTHTHTHTHIYIYIYTYTQTQCFPSVIKSSHAQPMGSPWRIQGPMLTVPAGHRGGCFPWTCFMRLHVFSLGIRSFRKKKRKGRARRWGCGFWASQPRWATDSSQPCTLTPQAAQVFDWSGSQ